MADWRSIATAEGWTTFSRSVRVPLGPRRHTVHVVDFAERNVLVLGTKHLRDAVDRQVQRLNFLARKVDVDLTAQAAVDRH